MKNISHLKRILAEPDLPDSQEMFFGVSCMVYGMVAAPGQDVSCTIQYRPWSSTDPSQAVPFRISEYY